MTVERGGWFGWMIGPLFFLLAAWFLAGPNFASVPYPGAAQVNRDALTHEPRRRTVGDPPTARINNFDRVCADCHNLFEPGEEPNEQRIQHTHIQLEHGVNSTCSACHDLSNMNQLVLPGGEALAYADAGKLCQSCHAGVYADWEGGVHGRTNGYWNAELGEPRRMECLNCHDPHQPRKPAMEPLVPLPGPNTLRMKPTEASHEHAHHEEADPLRRAMQMHRDHDSGGETR